MSSKAASAASPLKLEVGKYYRTRDGRKAGPVRLRTDKYDGTNCSGSGSMRFPYAAQIAGAEGEDTYDALGRFDKYQGECGRDLVAEWVDAPDRCDCSPYQTCKCSLYNGQPATVNSDEQVVAAFNELVKQGRVQVEAGGNEWVSNTLSTYRLKPSERRTRLPDSGYEVVVEGETVKVGCFAAKRKELKSILADFAAGTGSLYTPKDGKDVCRLMVRRDGVEAEGRGKITWADADALLKFLEEA